MAPISWLHFSDLHQGVGQSTQKWLWPSVQAELLKDLEKLHDKAGPWDLVLFTGDLTQTGSVEEFKRLNDTLQSIWDRLAKLGSTPYLMAVPGNHDLVRPDKKSLAVKMLGRWWDDPDVEDDLFSEGDQKYQPVLRQAFEPFTAWYEEWRGNHPAQGIIIADWKSGVMSGDFSATVRKGSLKLAVVGLNSAFAQLTPENFEKRILLHPQQLLALTQAPTDWIDRHHASLLLTHHPVGWLHEKSLEYYNETINPPGRFAAHLFGHLHQAADLSLREGGASQRRYVQGSSLLGLEQFGHDLLRTHGYSCAQITRNQGTDVLKVWPRRASKKRAGHWGVSADSDFELAEHDNSYSMPIFLNHQATPVTASTEPVSDRSEHGPHLPSGVDGMSVASEVQVAEAMAGENMSLHVVALDEYCRTRGMVLGSIDKVKQLAYSLSSNHLGSELGEDRKKVERGPTLAIVGSFSSGKTTFVNALFGQDLLPVSNQPTTAAITEIRSSKWSSVSIALKPSELIEEERRQAEKRLAELREQPDLEVDPTKDPNYVSLMRVSRSLSDFAQVNTLPLAGYRLDRPEDRKNLELFMTDIEGTLAHYVERVSIDFPFDKGVLPEGVTLLDTPGANSPFEFHLQATYRALQLADAVLFFIHANAPLAASDRELLRDIARIRRKQKATTDVTKDRFIFVLNAIDLLDAEKGDLEKTLEKLRQNLEDLGIENPLLCGLSSKLALLGRKARQGIELTKKERSMLQVEADGDPGRAWELSGMGGVLQGIWTLIGGALGQSILQTGLLRARERLQQLTMVLEEKIAASNLKPNEVKNKIDAIQGRLERKRKLEESLTRDVKKAFETRMRGFSEVESLKELLLQCAEQLKSEDGIKGQQIRDNIKEWTEDRYHEVQETLETVTERIGRLLALELEEVDELRRKEFELPGLKMKPIRFDTFFDLDTKAPRRAETIIVFGAIGGSFLGALLGFLLNPTGMGIFIGASAGASVGGTVSDAFRRRVRELRLLWANRLESQIEEKCQKIQLALKQSIDELSREVIDWVLRQFEGYLADLEQQLKSLERISREAEDDRPRVTKVLEDNRTLVLNCSHSIDASETQVMNLVRKRDELVAGQA